MYTPPPPAYRSTPSTPAPIPQLPSHSRHSHQRFSSSTTITTSTHSSATNSSQYSNQSFEFSPLNSSAPSILTAASSPLSIKDHDKDRLVGTIREHGLEEEQQGREEEEEEDSPVDPQLASPSVPRISQPYVYFSPLEPVRPPQSTTSKGRKRPIIPPRSLSNTTSGSTSIYPYPLDYGESWAYCNELSYLRGGNGTPNSQLTFKTTATDGSEDCSDSGHVELGMQRRRRTNQSFESTHDDERGRSKPSRINTSTSTGGFPLKPCLKSARPFPPSPINATSPILPLPSPPQSDHAPFHPTSPLIMTRRSSLLPSPVPAFSFLSTTSSDSSLTVTPPSATLTPTLSRTSHSPTSTNSLSPPQRIWSVRTNRYIWLHSTPSGPSTSAPPSLRHSRSFLASTSNLDLTLPGTRREEESTREGEKEMMEVPNLPYVTRAPEEMGRTVRS
ncbi:uncharacterized protein JCM6883_000222 [Sporobolomyces salmoneus]|uniref:uncharacterized protein n=1 Tax=Sporobolomyces salmoneus TaxID=183962 RepID=UPI00317C5FA6